MAEIKEKKTVTAKDLYDQGVNLFNKKQYEESIDFFKEALNIDPKYSKALFDLGRAYYMLKNSEKAIEYYEKYLDLKPKSHVAYNNLGNTYYRLKKDSDTAIEKYLKALEINPEFSLTLKNLGSAYFDKEEYDKAIDSYKKAIELKKDYVEIYYSIGSAYYNKKDYTNAILYYKKCLNHFPNQYSIYFDIGDAYKSLKDYKPAIENYCIASDINKKTDNNKEFESKIISSILYYLDSTHTLWNNDCEELKEIDNFFINLVTGFKEQIKDKPANESLNYKNLVKNIYQLWQKLCFSNKEKAKYIYQYTSENVLKNVIKNHKLRLTPADYQNDPMEGEEMFNILIAMSDKKKQAILKKIKEKKEDIAFIRCFTKLEDNLVMWDSSYAQNGKGYAIGISPSKLNKGGYGIQKLASQLYNSPPDTNTKEEGKNTTANIADKENSIEDIKIGQLGLYRVLYVSDNLTNKTEEEKHIAAISKYFNNINEKDFENEDILELISSALIPLRHLIKHSTYAHEEEYRLMYVGSVKNNKQYIKTDLDIYNGIYMETEPILFKDSDNKDIIYLGPKINDIIKKSKLEHALAYSDIDSKKVEVKSSTIKYR